MRIRHAHRRLAALHLFIEPTDSSSIISWPPPERPGKVPVVVVNQIRDRGGSDLDESGSFPTVTVETAKA